MERRALPLGVNLATRPGSTFAQIRATMLSPGVPWVFVLRRWGERRDLAQLGGVELLPLQQLEPHALGAFTVRHTRYYRASQ